MSLFRRIGLYGGVAAILISVALPAAAAYAQTAQAPPVRPPLNLMTSPLPLNVITKPGETVTADLRVKNNGTQPEQLKVELLKFGASGDTGRPQLQEKEPTDMYFNWVSFSETNFRAEPNVWKTIKMTIKAPKEAAFGYYFAVLFARANPDRPGAGQSGVEGGVASLVLLNVDAPGARREAKVAELVATQKVYEFLPAKFSIKLRNSGNVHVSPAGSVFIKRGNAQVAAINFNEERGNILPGTNRVFDMNWNDGFPSYKETTEGGKTTRSLEWDFSKIQKLRFGKYTATLVAVYDDGERDVPIEAVVSFWVIPWRILGVLLLILLFIGGGLWGMGRLIWKGIRSQAAAPVSDEPDASSLAAAPKRTKKPKQQKPQKKAKPAAVEAEEDEGIAEESAPVAAPTPKAQATKPVKRARRTAKAEKASTAPAPAVVAPEPVPEPAAVEEPVPAKKKPARKKASAPSVAAAPIKTSEYKRPKKARKAPVRRSAKQEPDV